MSERSILMSGPMVRAILAGKKTQTRRLVDPKSFAGKWLAGCEGDGHQGVFGGACAFVVDPGNFPPYIPGMKLWVREAWAHDAESLEALRTELEDVCGSSHGPYYRADTVHENSGLTWHASIHMPRWASRLVLEVTDVRVERLQDITETDACAEGMGSTFTRDCKVPKFAAQWAELHRGPGKRWEDNPWVYVIDFTTVKDAT